MHTATSPSPALPPTRATNIIVASMVAYARKKKRLDEEYEVLLEAVDQKRRAVEDLDRKLDDCHDRERTKEDALKKLERELVEVLVEQQKRLLKILTDAGTSNARYQKAKEANQKRADQIKGKAPDGREEKV